MGLLNFNVKIGNITLPVDACEFSGASYVGWTPADLTFSPLRWYSAAESSVTLDGSDRVIEDIGRMGYNLIGPSADNSLATVTDEFCDVPVILNTSGEIVDDSLNAADLPSGDNPITVFVLGMCETLASEAILFRYGQGFHPNFYYRLGFLESASNSLLYPTVFTTTGSTVVKAESDEVVSDGQSFMLQFEAGDGESLVVQDGDPKTASTDAAVSILSGRDLGSGTLEQFRFGSSGGGDKLLCELLIFDRKLTNTERQLIEGYAAWRYGQASLLPVSHPYKSAPPPALTSDGQTDPGWPLIHGRVANIGGSLGSMTLKAPPSLQVGQMLVAIGSLDNDTGATPAWDITGGAGSTWSQESTSTTGATGISGAILWRLAEASDIGATFTMSVGKSEEICGQLFSFDADEAECLSAPWTTGSTASVPIPDFTPSWGAYPTTYLVAGFCDGGGTFRFTTVPPAAKNSHLVFTNADGTGTCCITALFSNDTGSLTSAGNLAKAISTNATAAVIALRQAPISSPP